MLIRPPSAVAATRTKTDQNGVKRTKTGYPPTPNSKSALRGWPRSRTIFAPFSALSFCDTVQGVHPFVCFACFCGIPETISAPFLHRFLHLFRTCTFIINHLRKKLHHRCAKVARPDPQLSIAAVLSCSKSASRRCADTDGS